MESDKIGPLLRTRDTLGWQIQDHRTLPLMMPSVVIGLN